MLVSVCSAEKVLRASRRFEGIDLLTYAELPNSFFLLDVQSEFAWAVFETRLCTLYTLLLINQTTCKIRIVVMWEFSSYVYSLYLADVFTL